MLELGAVARLRRPSRLPTDARNTRRLLPSGSQRAGEGFTPPPKFLLMSRGKITWALIFYVCFGI